MSFGNILTQLRQEQNVVQKELAKYLNVSIGTISNYEKNKHFPDPTTLCKLADFFGVSVDYLLGRTNFRYDSQTLSRPFTKSYTVSDIMNTSLELSPKNKRALAEYIDMLRRLEEAESSRK